MQTFQAFLDSRNIDQQSLAPELRAALAKQWQAESVPSVPMVQSQPETILLIPDSVDERWSRAVRLPVCEVGA